MSDIMSLISIGGLFYIYDKLSKELSKLPTDIETDAIIDENINVIKDGKNVSSFSKFSDALKYAVNKYDVIKIRGQHVLSESITINKSNTVILGDNRLNTKITVSSSDNTAFILGDGENYTQHIYVMLLHIIGQGNDNGIGVRDNGCQECHIIGNLIEKFKYGIYLQGSQSLHSREGFIAFNRLANTDDGVRAESYSHGYNILLNYIINSTNGINLAGSLENNVLLNWIPYGVQGIGIRGYNANRNLIAVNHLFGVGTHGIQFAGSSQYNSIVANYVQGPSASNPNSYDAIRLLDTAKRNSIVANYVNGLGRTRYGINTKDSTGGENFIAKNTIFGTTSGRYNINSADYCDDCIYTELPSSFFLPGALVKYYDGTKYYLALWTGSDWRIVELVAPSSGGGQVSAK